MLGISFGLVERKTGKETKYELLQGGVGLSHSENKKAVSIDGLSIGKYPARRA